MLAAADNAGSVFIRFFVDVMADEHERGVLLVMFNILLADERVRITCDVKFITLHFTLGTISVYHSV